MHKQTLLLIGTLVAVVGLLVFAAFYTKKTSSPTKDEVSKKPTATFAQTDLTLSNPKLDPLTSTYSVDVNIKTGDNSITGVQLEMSYDPNILTDLNIAPGTFFSNSLVLLKKVDDKNGKISFALTIPIGQKGLSGEGKIAEITFTTPVSTTTQTSINFLPKSQASAEGIAQSVLKSTTGNLFSVGEGPESSSATTSANQ